MRRDEPFAQVVVPAHKSIDTGTLNGIVQRFTPDGRFVNEIATATTPGDISRPVAVQTLGDETILVVDQGDQTGVRRFEVSGKFVANVRPSDDVLDPVGLARDDAFRIYILDRDGERVLRLHRDLSPDTQILDLAEYLHDN